MVPYTHLFRKAVLASALALCAADMSGQTALTRLGEFKVNAVTAGDQLVPVSACDAAGNFVIAWESADQDGSGKGIFAQRYNRAGSPVGGVIQVNRGTLGDQASPAVAMHADGQFVIAWQSFGQDGNGWGIFLRAFNSQGMPLSTNDLPGNALTNGSQVHPQVAMAASGNFVLSWESDAQDNGFADIYARRFSANGAPRDSQDIRVTTAAGLREASPRIASFVDGRFVVVWTAEPAGGMDVRGRLYAEAGSPEGPEFLLSAATGDALPDVAVLADGSFVAAWQALEAGAPSTDIVYRRFTSGGTPIDIANRLANVTTAGMQNRASVAASTPGGFAIAWQGANIDLNGEGIAVRRFAADGTAVDTAEVVCNLFTPGDQSFSIFNRGLAVDGLGAIVVAWQSANQDNSGSGVFAEKFFPQNQGPPTEEFRVNTRTGGDQVSPAVAMNGSGNGVVVWVGPDGNGASDIFGQRMDAAGLRVGPEFLVNAGPNATVGAQTQPAVAMDQPGRFVVVWTGPDADGSGIYHQRFDVDGTPLNPGPVRVNSTEGLTQDMPSVGMSAAGDYVIVWRGGDGSTDGVLGQRYNASGVPVATSFLPNQFRVNVTTAGGQLYPSVSVGADGRFVVVWTSENQRGSQSFDDIYARVFAADGLSVIRDEFEVNQDSVGDQTVASVALASDGKFIVSWSSSATNNGPGEIVARRFAADGTPDLAQPNEVQVNDTTTRTQILPSVAIDGAGRSIVMWSTAQNSIGTVDDLDVYAKRYDQTGNELSDEFPLNVTRVGGQMTANFGHRVAFDAIGNYIAVWQSDNQDGTGRGVYATRVFLTEPPTLKTLPVGAADVASTSALLTAEVDPNGQSLIVAFEYDEDASFGSPEVKQVTGTFTGVNPPDPPAQVLVDGLRKDVKYYYRAKAFFGSQVLLGNTLDFTTANAGPVAADDLLFVAGSQATFQPQTNDLDPDQSSTSLKLLIADRTAKDAAGNVVGTLTLGSGDTTVTFVGQGSLETATFKYQAQDADGALSNEATVTLKSFAAAGGTYQGLVTADDGTTGTLTLVLNRVGGAFTGSFTWKGVTYPLDSAFPSTGVLRFALEGTTFELKVQIFEDGSITGLLFESDVEIADVDLDIIDGGSSGEPVTPGSYTTFLDLPEDDTTTAAQGAYASRGETGITPVPGGAGYVLVKIKKSTKRPASFVGKLPDGEKLSYGAPGLSRKRRYTLVQALYKTGKKQFAGGIVGRPQFLGDTATLARGIGGSALQGELIWNKTAVPGAVSFPEGFPPNLRLALFALLFKATKEPIDFDQGLDPNARLEFKSGGLLSETYVTMYVDSRNHARIVLDSTPAFVPKLKIIASNPVFSGSFLHPATGVKSKYFGILQQGGFGAETSGRGYFRTVDPTDIEGRRQITGRVKLRKLPLTN